MMFLERIRELFKGLLPLKNARKSLQSKDTQIDPAAGSGAKGNPWTQDLERFSCYTKENVPEPGRSQSVIMKISMLMDQAHLQKAKEILKQQQERLELGEAEAQKQGRGRKPRTTDATITDAKAWWGQAVATWDPEDAKNLGPQGEIRHPRQHKWFNQ